MKKRVILSCIVLVVLVVLAAAPVLAATLSSTVASCPSSCSCLYPAEAAKINAPGLCGGKQMVCGGDAKNEKYCYAKPVTTTPIVPQLIFPAKTLATTTPATPAPQKCAPGCICLSMADGKAKGLLYCGGKQTFCGNNTEKIPLYCFAQPPGPAVTGVSPAPTLVTGLRVISPVTTAIPAGRTPVPIRPACAAGCACLRPDDAKAKGLLYCNGKQTPCTVPALKTTAGDVLEKETRYCYSMVAGSSVPAPVLIPAVIKTNPIPVPAGPGMASSAARPASGGDVFSVIGTFFASILGSTPQVSPYGEASLSMCKVRYGLDTCADGCVNLSTDPDNCGSCGHWCRSGERCLNGRCSNFKSDPANCGGAGNVCPPGAPCIEGYCSALGCLDSYLTDCNNTCTRTSVDPLNCGACGNVCPAGQDCSWGCTSCSAAGDMYCPAQDSSYLSCTNITTDRHNCGRCQHACGSQEICSRGVCSECPAGTGFCQGDCVDFNTSARHCGGCYFSCGYGQTCQDGTCQCNPPLMLCFGQCVDLNTSRINCGHCGFRCSPLMTCSEGICVNCPTGSDGYGLCPVGGVNTCVNKNTDIENCGFCGRVCPYPWFTGCVDGACE